MTRVLNNFMTRSARATILSLSGLDAATAKAAGCRLGRRGNVTTDMAIPSPLCEFPEGWGAGPRIDHKRKSSALAVARLQHSKQFNQSPLIDPCLRTIGNQDLMVPFEGFEDGLTGRCPLVMAERPPLGRGGLLFRGLIGQVCRGMG